MKTKFLAILLLTIFAVSSLEGVWSYAGFDFDGGVDVNEFDNEAVEVNEFNNEAIDVSEANEFVNRFDQLDESDLFDVSEESNKEKHKHKNVCQEKSEHYAEARCMKSNCKDLCKKEGYKTGKCRKWEEDKVKKCYCVKHGKDCKKKHHAPAPSSPADAPGSSADAPEHSPSSPVYAPAPGRLADAPKHSPSTPADAPKHSPSTPTDAPKHSPSTPADAPTDAPGSSTDAPEHSPSSPIEGPESEPTPPGSETPFFYN